MMNVNTFYSYSLDQRLALLNKSGEYISRIPFYGHMVSLYICSGAYMEVFYNRHSQSIAAIELLDPRDARLHQYAVPVNLSHLYQK